MPAKLWPFFGENRHLLTLLFKLAAEPLLQTASGKKITIGIFSALHTFGRDLKLNIHVHVSVTRGGLSQDSNEWKDIYFTKAKVMPMWRYSIIDLLRQEYKKGTLVIPEEYQHQIKSLAQLNRLLNPEYKKHWNVYFAKAKRDHKHNVDYLGRYIKRPPLAESRLVHYDGPTVIFRYLDHYTKTQQKYECDTEHFIKLITQHIPEKFFKMIRYFGFLSYRTRGKLLPKVYELLGQVVKEPPTITYAELFAANFYDNPALCLVCNSPMIPVYTQPETTLESLKPYHKALATRQIIEMPTAQMYVA